MVATLNKPNNIKPGYQKTEFGLVPEDWQLITLNEVIEIKHGHAFKSELFSDIGSYMVLTPGNFFEEGGFKLRPGKDRYYSSDDFPIDYILNSGDVIIAMTEQAEGLLGSTAFILESGIYLHNQRLGLVIERKPNSIDKKFIYYLFNSIRVRKQIKVSAAGTKVKHTSPERLGKVLVAIPKMVSEQANIAKIIEPWDEAIAKTEALIETKSQLKKALMQRLLTGQLRFSEFVKSREYAETQYGAFPKDWQKTKIKEFAKEMNSKNDAGEDLTVLSCTKYKGLVNSLEYFGKQIFSEDTSTYKIVQQGQFAYATNHIEEGSIGYLEHIDKGLVSPMYTVFETDGSVNNKFLYKLLKTDLLVHIYQANTSASVDRRGSLRWKEFSKIDLYMPSLLEQAKIASVLNTIDEELDLLGHNLEALKLQKKGLMQQLLTGKVRVKG